MSCEPEDHTRGTCGPSVDWTPHCDNFSSKGRINFLEKRDTASWLHNKIPPGLKFQEPAVLCMWIK